jgi:hypothetical protein
MRSKSSIPRLWTMFPLPLINTRGGAGPQAPPPVRNDTGAVSGAIR